MGKVLFKCSYAIRAAVRRYIVPEDDDDDDDAIGDNIHKSKMDD